MRRATARTAAGLVEVLLETQEKLGRIREIPALQPGVRGQTTRLSEKQSAWLGRLAEQDPDLHTDGSAYIGDLGGGRSFTFKPGQQGGVLNVYLPAPEKEG